MCKFYMCALDLGFTGILGDPKFGAIHMRVQHCIALTAYTWLTLVINCNNEVCSHSNNTVSREFFQKKVRSLQKISYCVGIYTERIAVWSACQTGAFSFTGPWLLSHWTTMIQKAFEGAYLWRRMHRNSKIISLNHVVMWHSGLQIGAVSSYLCFPFLLYGFILHPRIVN